MDFKKDSDLNLEQFPTTRYQGSKRKILPWIYENVKDLEFETVLDVFGGSASVSYLFKKMNKEVTYNDKLKFNHLIGKALIENSNVFFDVDDVQRLTKDNLPNVYYQKTIQKNFKGIYYLDKENKWLDRIVSNIIQMNHYTDELLEYKQALAFYAVFQSCLIKRPFNLFHRNNLNLRTTEVVRNFGNKSTWDRPFKEYLKQFLDEANNLVFNNARQCKSLNESAFQIDPYGYELVYLDPPYIAQKRNLESSDYMRCYHFLEGLVDYPNWEKNIDKSTSNLRLKNLNLDADFKKENVKQAFEELITRFQNSTIVLSYKVGGIPSINYLGKLIKKVKGNVRIATRHYKYALNHQNGDAKKNREVLIIGE